MIKIPSDLRTKLTNIDSVWANEISFVSEKICNDLNFKVLSIEPLTRYGLVLYGEYLNKSAAIKFIPPNNSDSKNEIIAMKKLNYTFMNTLIVSDTKLSYYISNKILTSNINRNFEDRLALIINFFTLVVNQKQMHCDELPYYQQLLLKRYEIIKQEYAFFSDNLIDAIKLYINTFNEGDEQYALHGDLRIPNLFEINKELIAIDPIGINAPIYFEFTRYIEDEIFMCPSYSDFRKKLHEIIKHISDLIPDINSLICALLIDSTYRTSSSIVSNEPKSIISRGITNIEWIKNILKEGG